MSETGRKGECMNEREIRGGGEWIKKGEIKKVEIYFKG